MLLLQHPRGERLGVVIGADGANGADGGAVRAKRSGSHDFTSHDVQHQLGAALNPGARVNLSNPDVDVSVEIRDRGVHFFSGRQPALGGRHGHARGERDDHSPPHASAET